MMRRLATGAVFAAFLPIGATAQNTDGNSLYEACLGNAGEVGTGFCVGYIVGVVEGIRYGVAVPLMLGGGYSTEEVNTTSDSVLMYCAAAEVENGQYTAVVNNYLSDNPATRHLPARGLIHIALREAFPCTIPE